LNNHGLWRQSLSKFKLHWHVILTHFPLSLFLVAAGFMALHLFTLSDCFEMAGFLTLIAGAVVMVPTTATGWWTWKTRYKGTVTQLFQYKINISIAMIAVCVILIVARGFLVDTAHSAWHWIFLAGFLLLFVGAMAEGNYGGKLNHHQSGSAIQLDPPRFYR
jgi:hypothetical protein